MGKEDKEKEQKEELKSENNPFAQNSVLQDEQDSKESDSDDAECIDAISSLKDEIEKINNQYIRLAADFDNYRKRQAQEREALLKYGAEETLKK